MASITQAQDFHTVANQIAETLGYPADHLTVRDESVEYAEKTNGQTLQVIVMESEDGTFARTAIAIAKRGFLWKPGFEATYNELIAEGLTRIQRFDLKQGAYGYAGLGMAGPGGSETFVIATWPDRGIDLQIKMSVPREGLAEKESTRAYHSLVITDASELPTKLTAAMGRIVDYVADTDIRYVDESKGDERK